MVHSFVDIMGRQPGAVPITWHEVVTAVAGYVGRRSLGGNLLPLIETVAQEQSPTEIEGVQKHHLETFLLSEPELVRFLMGRGLDLRARFGVYLEKMSLESSLTRIGSGRGAMPRDVAAVLMAPAERVASFATTAVRLTGALRCGCRPADLLPHLTPKMRALALDSSFSGSHHA